MTHLLLALWMFAAGPAVEPVSLKTVPAAVVLNGAGATQQFLAVAAYSDGSERDVTAEVEWRIGKPELAKSAAPGRLTAAADGEMVLAATFRGVRAQSSVRIAGAQAPRTFSFARDIGAVLTRRGCNDSACHGGVKGRGGFKLSANVLAPHDDHEWIVKGGVYQVLTTDVAGARVPRVDVREPEKSLLLMKATAAVPHGGGQRFDRESADYRTIFEWVRSGVPYGTEGSAETKLTRLEVYPSMIALPVGSGHRVLVTARFSDGHTEDFTRDVVYSSNDTDVASVGADGIVTAKRRGETAILIRAAGHAAAATVGVIGPPMSRLPAGPAHELHRRARSSPSSSGSTSFRLIWPTTLNFCGASVSI